MQVNRDIVLGKQRRRYQLLLELWKASNGKQLVSVDFMEIALEAGFENEEATDIYRYFQAEGFFQRMIPIWIVSLSHRAIVEIERSFTSPDQSTEHFPARVIQYFNAPVGAVQTGPQSTANVTQSFGPNLSEAMELIAQLRKQFASLPSETRQEAVEVVDSLSEELQRSSPTKGRIRAFLLQVSLFGEQVAAQATTTLLAEAVAKYLGWS